MQNMSEQYVLHAKMPIEWPWTIQTTVVSYSESVHMFQLTTDVNLLYLTTTELEYNLKHNAIKMYYGA